MTIYFDNNATTPMDPEVREAMMPYFDEFFGNPSSIHLFGQNAKRGLDLAREQCAELIGADPEEIVFTSGGTESNNLAIKSIAPKAHAITSAVEHHAVHGPLLAHERLGGQVTQISVDSHGGVSLDELSDALTNKIGLVTIMTANNDVGTLQPVAKISEMTRKKGVPFHTDAVQAVGKIPVNVDQLGIDLLAFSSHKIHGPKGAGALYVRRGTRLNPLLHGGFQESRRRAGTENIPALVGFGKACALAATRVEKETVHLANLRTRLEHGITSSIRGAHLLGSPNYRLPGTLCIGFEGVEGDTLMMALDLKGVAVSTGAACASESQSPSHVLEAMGVPAAIAKGAIRFSLGRFNTIDEVDQVIEIVTHAVANLVENG